jgi:hypothetical protein
MPMPMAIAKRYRPLHHILPLQDTHTSEKEKKRTVPTFMQVSLHVQQILMQVPLSPSILLVPNSLSTTELLDAVYLPIIGFRTRLMAVVSISCWS